MENEIMSKNSSSGKEKTTLISVKQEKSNQKIVDGIVNGVQKAVQKAIRDSVSKVP